MLETIEKIIKENQQKAVDVNKSVWVSASAGSGKTTILVNRLINLLISGVDIKKIVCITYTNNAANEMKERIYSILEDFMIMDEKLLKEEIKKINNLIVPTKEILNRIKSLFINILDNVDNLKIFTIHSFCQQIISKFPIEAGILPNFSIISETKKNNLVEKSINFFISNIDKYDTSATFDRIINMLSEDDFKSVIASFIGKKKEIDHIKNIDFEKCLLNNFNLSIGDTKDTIIEEYFQNSFDFSHFSDFLAELKEDNSKNEAFFSLINIIKNKSKNIDDYIKTFLTKDKKPRKVGGFSTDVKKNTELSQMFLLESEKVYNLYQKLQNFECYNNTIDTIKLAFAVVDIYNNLKTREGFLDFDDLILLTSNLLKNTEYSEWIKYKLDDRIEHILLDETQDTSEEQWKIVDSLTEDFFAGKSANENIRTLFVVGDEKQSIFKFQGAAPELFNDKYNYYKNKTEDFEKIDLEYSFRSAKNILKFVDKFYESEDFSSKISKISNTVKHNIIRDNVEGLVEIWPLVDVEKQEYDAWSFRFELEKETEIEKINAYNIASKIKSFFENKKQLTFRDGKKDYIKYSDIMLLIEKRTGMFLFYLIKYLNLFKIPNSGFDRIDLFTDIFIKDLLCLIYFCRFEYDDMNLANIIKSPILNLTENDLFNLCDFKNKNSCSLYEAMKSLYPQKYNFLEKIIEKSHKSSIYDFCFFVLEELKIKECIIERAGEEYNDIINEFYSFIKEYERAENSDFVMFLNYVFNNENEIKKDFNSTKLNQVRIMTRHSSKGLQSPIVFICDANKNINTSERSALFWHNKKEFNFPLLKRKIDSDVLDNFVEMNKIIAEEEKFRLFYVAITRAENELYICGTKRSRENNNDEEVFKSFYELALDTLINLNCKSENFEFDDKLLKYYIGSEEISDNLEIKDVVIEKKNYSEFISKLKNTTISSVKKEIHNPSQFFKHNDRDKAFEGINMNIIKGLAVHKLLEVLPPLDVNSREEISDIYLNNLFNELENNDKITIKEYVNKILNSPEYSQFFVANSKAEVSVVGEVDGMNISGQIDRLVEFDDRVVILDYKNTRKDYINREEIPINYIKQLEFYKKLAEQHYKNKTVECHILLTGFFRLIRIW